MAKTAGWRKRRQISIDIVSENTKGIRTGYSSFDIYVAGDSIDPWLSYRLLYPGYEAYSQISIKQRSTESFRRDRWLRTSCSAPTALIAILMLQ